MCLALQQKVQTATNSIRLEVRGKFPDTRFYGAASQPGQWVMLLWGLADMWMGRGEVTDRDSGSLGLMAQEGLDPVCISVGRKSSVWNLQFFHGAFIIAVCARGSFLSSQMTQPWFHGFLLLTPDLQPC